MTAEAYPDLDSLPTNARALLSGESFFATEAWFRLAARHALPEAAATCFLVCHQPLAVLPLRRDGRALSSLTTPYTARFAPSGTEGMTEMAWCKAGFAMGRWLRRHAEVRLDAIDSGDPWLPGFTTGLRQSGLLVSRFDHFGNRHEDVSGTDWAAYLRRRPGSLRETLRRKGRKAEHLRFETITSLPVDRAVRAYETVYAKSWKEAEPFPGFAAALIREGASAGGLRLGLCWDGDSPIAAQIWIVHGRQASVHKLAHDEARKAESPGTLLTASVLRPLLDSGTIDEVDFGRGDDGYKQAWASGRRQRIGLLIINPRRSRGAAIALREVIAKGLKRVKFYYNPKAAFVSMIHKPVEVSEITRTATGLGKWS